MRSIKTAAAAALTMLTLSLTGCATDSPEPAAAPVADAPSGEPHIFNALDCDSTKSVQDGFLWSCTKDSATAWYYPGDTVEIGVTDITATPGVHYNPDGDVFYQDADGVLYLPGTDPFFEAMLALADPDDIYGATVVDTDVL